MTVSNRVRTNRAWVEIDLANLAANARTVQAAVRGARLLPMVKADAYGLGAVPCVRALDTLDPWGYGVATVPEAVELRVAGITRPILVVSPVTFADLRAYRQHDLRAMIDDPEVAATWDVPFHVEVDTGMGRCGVRWDDPVRLAACLTEHAEGIYTHFMAADETPGSMTTQLNRFRAVLHGSDRRPRLVHVANSAACFRLTDHFDLVRPGIFLYGGLAAPDLPPPLPVASVRAPVTSLRRLNAGDTVSYGGEWSAKRQTVVATVGIGYADGIPRGIGPGTQVLVGGARYPVVGRITMDFIMIDVGDAPVRVGDVATVIGRDGAAEITVDEFAGWAETISLEILARLGPRLAREYRSR